MSTRLEKAINYRCHSVIMRGFYGLKRVQVSTTCNKKVHNLVNLCIKVIGTNHNFCNKSLFGLIPNELIEKINKSSPTEARYRNIHPNKCGCEIFCYPMIKYPGNTLEIRYLNITIGVVYPSEDYINFHKNIDQYYTPTRFNKIILAKCRRRFAIDDELDKRFNRICFEYVSMRSSKMPNFYADIRKNPYID
jgi:hypothetical protein